MGDTSKTAHSIARCEVHVGSTGKHKLLYTSRRVARQIAKLHGEHKGVYRCSEQPDLWHVGRLPEAVRHGHLTKSEYYGSA